MYIRHYTAAFWGSVGINVAVKGVYSELDLIINILSAELKKAITNIQKSQIRMEMIALEETRSYSVMSMMSLPFQSSNLKVTELDMVMVEVVDVTPQSRQV